MGSEMMAQPQGVFDLTVQSSSIDTITNSLNLASNSSGAQVGAPYANIGFKGILVMLNVSAIGSATLLPKIAVCDAYGAYYTVATWTTAISQNGTYTLFLYPSALNVTSGANQSQNGALTHAFKLIVTQGGSGNATYSLSFVLVH